MGPRASDRRHRRPVLRLIQVVPFGWQFYAARAVPHGRCGEWQNTRGARRGSAHRAARRLAGHRRRQCSSSEEQARRSHGGNQLLLRHHRAQTAGRGTAQSGRPAERDFQQRQLLQHRHRRQGRHPDLQRRRRAHAGLHGRRGDEQDHAGRYLRSAGSGGARRSIEHRTRNPDHAGLRGPDLQGIARHRGHL